MTKDKKTKLKPKLSDKADKPIDPASLAGDMQQSKSIDDSLLDESKPVDESKPGDVCAAKEKAAQEKELFDLSNAKLVLPIHHCIPGYATCSLETKMTRRQAAAAKILWSSLSEHGERYQGGGSNHPDGTVVDCAAHSVRFIFDRLADAIEKQTGKKLVTDFDLSFR